MGAAFHSEVVRDLRDKESSAGQVFSGGELEQWKAQVNSLLEKPDPESVATKRRKLNRDLRSLPRIATLDFLRSVENQLVTSAGRTLKSFENAQFLSIPPPPPGPTASSSFRQTAPSFLAPARRRS